MISPRSLYVVSFTRGLAGGAQTDHIKSQFLGDRARHVPDLLSKDVVHANSVAIILQTSVSYFNKFRGFTNLISRFSTA